MKINRRPLFQVLSVTFFITIIFSTCLLLNPSLTLAQSAKQSTESLNFKPQISIPNSDFTAGVTTSVGSFNEATGKMQSDLLARYMLAIINYALAAVAILATVVLMGGGLLWLTSRGDSGQIGKAKGLIGGSLTGMILLLCSWIILNTINPELTKLQSINTQILEPKNYSVMTCCHPELGEINVKVILKDGKKIALEGENKGKPVRCMESAPECINDTMCGSFKKNESFSCIPNLFCCTCATPSSIDGEFIGSCYKNISSNDCQSACGGINNVYTMSRPENECGEPNSNQKKVDKITSGSVCISSK